MLRDMPAYKKNKEEEKGPKTPLKINKLVNVPDQKFLKHLERKKDKIEEEAKAPDLLTFEDFEKMYLDHLEGRVDPAARLAGRPDTAAVPDLDDETRSPKSKTPRNRGLGGSRYDKMKTPKGKNNAGAADEESKEESSQPTDEPEPAAELTAVQRKKMREARERLKYKIDDNCKLEMLKLNRIEKLDLDYVLVAHPYPQLEGEMLLFQMNPEESEDKECILYRDYSLQRRLLTEKEDKSEFLKKKDVQDDQEKSKLQCREINIENPLSYIDWKHFTMVIKEI